MRLTVFGATGGTGHLVVTQALEAGHEVTAMIRNPEALDIAHPNLEIVQGDVMDPSPVNQVITGKEAVISALGVSHRRPTTVYSEGTGNIMKAMQAAGVRRLLVLSSAGLEIHADTPRMQRLVIRLVIQRIYQNAYEDMLRMEDKVKKMGLDWTVVRPPRLTNGSRTGEYRTAVNQPLPQAQGIARADLADYLVSHLQDDFAYKSIVEISY